MKECSGIFRDRFNATHLLFSVILIALAVYFMPGCSKIFDNDDDDDDSDSERITVNNDAGDLQSRIQYKHEDIEIDTTGVVQKIAKPYKKKFIPENLTLILVAEVHSPEHNGFTLQATDIELKGNKAYVSYNIAGSTFLGAVDIFDISDPDKPVLLSSAVFKDTDVNGITIDGDYLYLASSAESPSYYSPAVCERVKLKGGLLSSKSTIVDLPSYAATDVSIAGDKVYVTSGALNGYVTILDKKTLAKEDSLEVDDARGVDASSSDVAVVAGTSARLYIFDAGASNLRAEHSLSGATIPFSKSTVEVYGPNAVMALGDGGTQIFDITAGSLVVTIPPPEVSGVDPSDSVTNAASAFDNLLFMACGGAGIYTAYADPDFKNTLSSEDVNVVGRFSFSDAPSVNHAAFSKNTLFVAAGLKGLKILTVSYIQDDDNND